MKQLFFFVVIALAATTGFAQSNAGIHIRVLAEPGILLENWPVKIYQGGREVMTVYTDEDGEALAKPLSPNIYEVRMEYKDVTKRVESIVVGPSAIPLATVDFRPGAPDIVQLHKGKIRIRVIDSTGKPVAGHQVVDVWQNSQLQVTCTTDEGGVATVYPLAPGTYEVRAKFRDLIHVATGIRVDSGEVWVSIYDKHPPRDPKKEQRAGIKAYRKWEKKQRRETEKAERKDDEVEQRQVGNR